MRCDTTYNPIINAGFWTIVYLFTIFGFMIGAVIIYDIITGSFGVLPNLVVLGIVGVGLLLVWLLWRRGLFLKSDFTDLIHRHGGRVTQELGVTRGRLNDLVIDAKFGRYLRGGAPFPSWHGSGTRDRPCGDPECMLCDSRLTIWRERKAEERDQDVVQLEEIVGGTWEGLVFGKRLERALLEVGNGGSREAVNV